MSLLFSFSVSAQTCQTLPYGNEKIYTHVGVVNSAKISNDNLWVISGSENYNLKITNLKSNTTANLEMDSEVKVISISPDSKFFAAGMNNGTVKVFSLATGTAKAVKTLKHWDRVNALDFSPNNQKLVSGSNDGRVLVLDLMTFKQEEIAVNSVIKSLKFFPDGTKILAGTSDGRVIMLVKHKPQVLFQKTFDFNSVAISRDGRFIAAGANEGMVFLRDLQSKKDRYFSHSNDVLEVAFSPDSKKLATASSDNKVKVINLDESTGFELDYSSGATAVAYSPDSQKLVVGYRDGLTRIIDLNSKKTVDEIRHRDGIRSVMFSVDGQKVLTAAEDRVVRLTDLKSVCQTPELVSPSICTLQSAFLKSTRLYEALVDSYPLENPQTCNRLSPEQQKLFSQKAYEYLLSKIAKTTGPTVLKDWMSLAPLVSVFSKWDESTQEKYHDQVAQSLADTAVSREFKGVFLSKIFKLAYRTTRIFFGDGKNFYTDLTYIRTPDEIEPLVLGINPIDGDLATLTPYGFYAKRYPSIPLPNHSTPGQEIEVFRGDFNWRQKSKNLRASFHVKALDRAAVFAEGDSPNYAAMKVDKKFVGLIITGTTLDSAKNVIEEYKKYFIKDGFRIKNESSVMNLEQFLIEGVSNGYLDYFIKEAHSDGDDRNLFEMFKFATVLTGIKQLTDGTEEIIHLALPPAEKDKASTVMVSNYTFGEAIRRREGTHAPLIYLNTSCWSATKAVHEIEMARSPLLIDIATLTSVGTFSDEKRNAMRILIESVRHGLSYEDTRQALLANGDYAGRVGNYFIFPDEEEYRRNIKSVLNILLDVDLKIIDETGQEYLPDSNQTQN